MGRLVILSVLAGALSWAGCTVKGDDGDDCTTLCTEVFEDCDAGCDETDDDCHVTCEGDRDVCFTGCDEEGDDEEE